MMDAALPHPWWAPRNRERSHFRPAIFTESTPARCHKLTSSHTGRAGWRFQNAESADASAAFSLPRDLRADDIFCSSHDRQPSFSVEVLFFQHPLFTYVRTRRTGRGYLPLQRAAWGEGGGGAHPVATTPGPVFPRGLWLFTRLFCAFDHQRPLTASPAIAGSRLGPGLAVELRNPLSLPHTRTFARPAAFQAKR